MSGLDPVEVLAEHMRQIRRAANPATSPDVTELDRAEARLALTQVWAQGARIVQLAECETEIDEAGELVPCWTVIYEWLPEAVR